MNIVAFANCFGLLDSPFRVLEQQEKKLKKEKQAQEEFVAVKCRGEKKQRVSACWRHFIRARRRSWNGKASKQLSLLPPKSENKRPASKRQRKSARGRAIGLASHVSPDIIKYYQIFIKYSSSGLEKRLKRAVESHRSRWELNVMHKEVTSSLATHERTNLC